MPAKVPLRFRFAAQTNAGHHRSTNEDCFGVAIDDRTRFSSESEWASQELADLGTVTVVVADGVGGAPAGEHASAAITRAACSGRAGSIRACHERIFVDQSTREPAERMGSTVTSLTLGPRRAHVNHVGDSRAYLLRNGTLRRVTTDHSRARALVRSGHLDSVEQADHREHKQLFQAVGVQADLEIDRCAFSAEPGDVWLLCSDGLTDLVDDTRIEEVLRHNTPANSVHLLVQSALHAGGHDNVTVAVVGVEGRARALGWRPVSCVAAMLVVVTAGVVWLLESGFLQRRTAQVRADDAPFAIDFPARPYPVVVGEDCLRIEGRVRDRTLREVVIDGERVPVRGDRFSTLVGFSRREATIVIRAAGHSEQVPVRFDLGIEFEAIAATAGGEATLRGHVASLSCREVTVNGESVVVGTRGRFRCKIPRETSQIEVLGRVGALEQRVTGLLRGR